MIMNNIQSVQALEGGMLTELGLDWGKTVVTAAALLAVQRGARIVRTHDVAATRDVLRVWMAVEADRLPGLAA